MSTAIERRAVAAFSDLFLQSHSEVISAANAWALTLVDVLTSIEVAVPKAGLDTTTGAPDPGFLAGPTVLSQPLFPLVSDTARYLSGAFAQVDRNVTQSILTSVVTMLCEYGFSGVAGRSGYAGSLAFVPYPGLLLDLASNDVDDVGLAAKVISDSLVGWLSKATLIPALARGNFVVPPAPTLLGPLLK